MCIASLIHQFILLLSLSISLNLYDMVERDGMVSDCRLIYVLFVAAYLLVLSVKALYILCNFLLVFRNYTTKALTIYSI